MNLEDSFDRVVENIREGGYEEGLDLGEKATLLRQLEFRFGPLPMAFVLRVATADEEELEHWTRRILAKKTIEAVFGGPIWARLIWDSGKKPFVSTAERLRHEGRLEGELQGRRATLIGQLEQRFSVSERSRERVFAGTPAELDVWTLRVLNCATLEEVFRASS